MVFIHSSSPDAQGTRRRKRCPNVPGGPGPGEVWRKFLSRRETVGRCPTDRACWASGFPSPPVGALVAALLGGPSLPPHTHSPSLHGRAFSLANKSSRPGFV